MTTKTESTAEYAILNPDDAEDLNPDDAEDHYAGTDVPGEFRRLTDLLGCSQLAVTLIRVPAHSDFEQGTGHFHDEIEEIYLVTRGTLTMRFGDEIREVSASSGCEHSSRSRSTAGTSRSDSDSMGSAKVSSR